MKGGRSGGKGGWSPKSQFYFHHVVLEVPMGSPGQMSAAAGAQGSPGLVSQTKELSGHRQTSTAQVLVGPV